MRWFTNIKDYVLEIVSSKRFLASIILLSILLVFWYQIWIWFNEVLVDPFLSCPQSSTLNDILFFVLAGIAITLGCIHFRDKRRVSKSIIVLTLFLTAIYIFWRFFSNQYLFVPLSIWPLIKLSDLVLLISIIVLALIIRDRFDQPQEPHDFEKPFLVDKPITETQYDIFGRERFAKEIAEKIQSKLLVEGAGAIAIGVNGVWGSGKTSFTNLIKCHIKPENRIIIDFNPWNSTSPSKIIEDFFEQLILEMSKYDPELSKNISEYAKTLTTIDENSITKGLNTFSEFIFDGDNKNYDEINKAIGNLKKQVIIFIDDLDRLDTKEIIEVLRLIRNTANFNKVVYIVSYDKQYVEVAINEFNPHNSKSFLEKIFQFEFTLPKYESGILRRNLIKELNQKLDSKFTTLINSAIEARTTSGKSFTNIVVRTQRDVIRLTNSFLFEFSLVEDEVHFIDFYLLQLLKLKNQNIYEQLYEFQDVFFISETKNNKKSLRLRKVSERFLDDKFSDIIRLMKPDHSSHNSNKSHDGKEKEEEVEIFKKYIQTKISSEFEREFIISLVNELLTEKITSEVTTNQELYKSFAYPGNFHKYFTFQLLASDLPAREFETLRRGSYELYKKKIFEWIEAGKLSEVIDWLEKINDFSSFDEFNNHLLISVDLGRFRLSNGQYYGLNYWQIIKILRYPLENNGSIRIFESKKTYRVYVRRFFNMAPSPYVFESNIAVTAMSDADDFILKNIELTSINYKYFKEYSKANKSITPEFRELYRNCVRFVPSYESKYEITTKATSYFKHHFKKFLKDCDLSGFIMHSSPDSKYFHIHNDWMKQIFKSTQHFETYLTNARNLDQNSDCYIEFMDFYNQSKIDNERFKSIAFNFEHLKPNLYR